ncbi:MAG TPA: benzaldehyde dehydrogenase [Enteractinococcus helveticum]|uniref:Benzaldehyde dehydrogenase n=1 Tax=Enteractinococcus helveticum TaxID=1837282 RepID=A0A921FS17_9MICC|nr:benzaldehyde dehydrogenase [Enteractinococcus helveticum]HJF15971.1 benzaldehyde dehydrogenase [Enteractinococcus helveticum]
MTQTQEQTTLLDDPRWHNNILSDGWKSGTGEDIAIIEPATGETLGTIGSASPDDVQTAAKSAAAAQKAWAKIAPTQRAAILRKAGLLFEQHAEELQSWIMKETGAIPPKADLELHVAAQECYEAAALCTAPQGDVLTSDEPRWSFARRRPAGVVAVISPFNFPLILSIRSVVPALALGNSVLLKPDPRTPVTGGLMIARVLEEAGLPESVLHLLPGGGDTGAAMTEAPEVRVVSFTGSTAAGRKVGEAASRNLKRAHLELGGNNALVVLPGADLDAAVSAGAFGAFMHQGQICMTAGRHLVHESLVEEYVAKLAEKAKNLPVGDPATEAVALGPVIDAGQRDNIHSIVEKAQTQGAKVEAGGQCKDLFYSPTVLSNVAVDNTAWADEIFGPVAPVMSFATIEDAAAIVNNSEYGLSVGILGDVGTAMDLADQIESGKIHINEQTVGDEANAPFGGVGASGTGSRFGGAQANIEAFTETQWLTVRSSIAQYPF